MSLETYNKLCHSRGEYIFPVTPSHLHSCTSNCTFHSLGPLNSICTISRQIHHCKENCPFAKNEESRICLLTGRTICPITQHRYWDGTSTLTTRKRKTEITPKQIKLAVTKLINALITGPDRIAAEEQINQRRARKDSALITKEARLNQLHRGNWHAYYLLYFTHSSYQRRFIPNKFNIEKLTNSILEFWQILFPNLPPTLRTIGVFAAVCIAELATGKHSIFPLIPWLKKSVSEHPHIYSQCAGISCRAMTGQLMHILDTVALSKVPVSFPVT
jgi:hypothetical protein